MICLPYLQMGSAAPPVQSRPFRQRLPEQHAWFLAPQGSHSRPSFPSTQVRLAAVQKSLPGPPPVPLQQRSPEPPHVPASLTQTLVRQVPSPGQLAPAATHRLLPPSRTQHPPAAHELSAQQAPPAAPQASQMPVPPQVDPAAQVALAQQGWPGPPQATQVDSAVLPLQMVPAAVQMRLPRSPQQG